jgi:hypothetical protein
MKLKRREQANNSARDTLASLSQAMILRDFCIRELVQASGLFHQKATLFKPFEIGAGNTLRG